MEPQDNKRVALQKAINAHEQAASALTDLMSALSEDRYTVLLVRIQQNLDELLAESATTPPAEQV